MGPKAFEVVFMVAAECCKWAFNPIYWLCGIGQLCGRIVPRYGVLVVGDTPGGIRFRVPGVLGMNVLWRCYQELFGQHGPALFDFTLVSIAPLSVFQTLQHCHQSSEQPPAECMTKVKMHCPRACRVTGSPIKLVVATCA